MTSLTYVNNTIMAYPDSSDEFTGHNTNVILPFWAGSYVYSLTLDTGSSGGIRKFNIDPDGTEVAKKTASDLGIFQVAASSGGAAALSYDGDFMAFFAHSANVVQLARIQTSDLTLLNTFGTAGSGLLLTQSDASNLLQPDKMVGILNAGVNRLFTGGGASTGGPDGEVCEFDFTSMLTNQRIGRTTQHTTRCLSLSGHNETSGKMYVLASPWTPGVGGSGAMQLYSVDTNTLTAIGGTIAPSDIDATWSTVLTHVGLVLDETDGHVIAGFKTNDTVTHKNYLVKFNTGTGAIIWATAVSDIPVLPWGMTFSRCKHQRYFAMRSTNIVDQINTNTGAITTTFTITGLNNTGSLYVSDDVTNSIIYHGGFNDSGGSNPDFVGAYMDTGGHHTVSGKWMRYWFATAGGGGGGDGGNRGGLTLSRKRAWTYTQDGHTFYVLDLSSEGTWVYDTDSREWAQFTTDGYTQWDVQAGIQWQSVRVVGGDLATEDMWELSPTLTQDHDGELNIPHLVTGALSTRSRAFLAVDGFRLTGSTYKIGDPAIADMLLRWSDDDGQTWSDYFSITLTAGTPIDVEWASLGSFNIPGRIFEVSDSGGMVRIDGADAFIEDWDDDSPQQGK